MWDRRSASIISSAIPWFARGTKTWEAFLYPGERALDRSSPVETIALRHPERDLGLLPGGELGILATFFGLSLAAGFALKGRFGVTL